MRWRWRFWHPPGNGDAARHATERAAEAIERAKEQTERADRLAQQAQDLTRRSDWFTRDMERALHLRRRST